MTSEAVMAISAAITGFSALAVAIIAIYRIAKKIGDIIGTDANGRTISDRLDRVEYQLWENGGTSLADRVNNIEKHVIKVSTEIEFIKDITMGIHTSQVENVDKSSLLSPEPVLNPVQKSPKKRKVS